MADILELTRSGHTGPRLLLVEPYLTASHRAFAGGLMGRVRAQWTMLGLPGRNFRWRMRGGALFLARAAAGELTRPWDGLVCSSMLNLAELRGLAPALATVPAVAVFHENQLAYPANGPADEAMRRRDLFLAFSNLSTALAARRVVFNSRYHQAEFMGAAKALRKALPDMRPPGLLEALEARATVLPVPVDESEAPEQARPQRGGPLRIVWNHRWEHEKDPEALFAALEALRDAGLPFLAAVIGPRAARWPKVFDEAPARLGERLATLGPAEDRTAYWQWLAWADVAVSTARQEYFGLSVAEAAWAGCMPLVPDDLVYPELYPPENRYPRGQLGAALARLAAEPGIARQGHWRALAQGHTWAARAGDWQRIIMEAIDV